VFRFGGLSDIDTTGVPLSPVGTRLSWGWLGLQSFIHGASDRIGSSLPLWSCFWPTFEVFALWVCPNEQTFGLPLLTFRSSSEFCRTNAVIFRVAPVDDFLPCGLFPFGVFPVLGSYFSRRVPASEYVPSQRFSRSQGLIPPGTCRPCFMPVPPVGFPLQGRSPPAEPFVLPDVDALVRLVVRTSFRPVGFRLPRDPGVSEVASAVFRGDGALSVRPLFRALLPASVRFSEVGCLSLPGDRDPPGVLLLGGFSPSAGDPPGVHPLTSLASGAHARPEAAPQSVRPTKGLAGLPRACRPFRGLSPCRHSLGFTNDPALGCPSEWVCCCQQAASPLRVVSSVAGAPGECRIGDGVSTKRPFRSTSDSSVVQTREPE
jgi:hypothetical protein